MIFGWDEIPHIIAISCSNRILFSSAENLSSSKISFNATSSHPNFYLFIYFWIEKERKKKRYNEWTSDKEESKITPR